MQKWYYLMNGNINYSTSLFIPVGNRLKLDFEDISTLDLATMNINKNEAKSYLGNYNPGIDKDGMFYIAGYPFKDKCRVFAPIFKYDKKGLKSFYYLLNKYAQQRNYNFQHNKTLTLNIENDRLYLEYIKGILQDIIDKKVESIYGDKSIISPEVKTFIRRRFLTQYKNLSTEEYLDKHTKEIICYYCRYTELRKLMLECILCCSGYNPEIGPLIWNTNEWPKDGIYGYKLKDQKNYTRQLQLSEFSDIPSIREK